MQKTAGTRTLENKLSHYLRAVNKRRSVTVTERGKIVATIVRAQHHRDLEALKKLAKSGFCQCKW